MALLVFFVTGAGSRADSVRFHLEHEGTQRGYYLYVPSSVSSKKLIPLVIALHGRGSDGRRMETLSEFNSRAERDQFIVIYPDAINGAWFYPRGTGGFGETPNDTGFILSLIDKLMKDHSVNPNRIYVTGISNGGFMAQRLACDAPDRIAAMVSVAATGFAGMEFVCNKAVPVPVMFIHGTEDRLVPWQGRSIQHPDGSTQNVTYSMSKTLNLWSTYNECKGQLSQGEVPASGESTGTRVTIIATDLCKQGSEVVLFSILGGGHNWPGVSGVIPARIAGLVNMDIHATDEIMKFFKRHSTY